MDHGRSKIFQNQNQFPFNNQMNFIVYSKDGCPFCTKIVQVFNLIEVKYVEYKLDRDFTREEFYTEFGEGTTFPQVLMDQKKL